MTKSLFISLPVTDLAASTAFYKALGFSQNPQFSSEDGSAMVWSEAIQVILVTHAKRSEEHTSELQSRQYLVCRLLLEKKKKNKMAIYMIDEVEREIDDLV